MNKQSLITILLTVLLSVTCAKALAHDIVADNADGVTIYYSWINNNTELEVSYRGSSSSSYTNEYFGNVIIPATVVYQGSKYKVTAIGYCAFEECTNLTSVSIPNSVRYIGTKAFSGCNEITKITVGKGVTSIGEYAFSGCSKLKSISLPNNITAISDYAFSSCSALVSFVIPNNVTSIGRYAFSGANRLNSIVIPNNVTSIGDGAFSGCINIGYVVLGKSVKNINDGSFAQCKELSSVYCLAENVPTTNKDAFYGSGIDEVSLRVPEASLNKYSNTAPWKNFGRKRALDVSTIPVMPTCAKPTISFVDGKIQFSCETEEVDYISEVTVSDDNTYLDDNITTPTKFEVSVYAAKTGYINSETATAEFNISSDIIMSGDVNNDGEVNVADHVKLSEIIMNQNE